MSTAFVWPDAITERICGFADLSTHHLPADWEELAQAGDVYADREKAAAIAEGMGLTPCLFSPQQYKLYLGFDSSRLCDNLSMLTNASLHTYIALQWNGMVNTYPFDVTFEDEVIHMPLPELQYRHSVDTLLAPRVLMPFETVPAISPAVMKHQVVRIDVKQDGMSAMEWRRERKKRRLFPLQMKAHLFKLIMAGQLSYATAEDRNKYRALAEAVVDIICELAVTIGETLANVLKRISFEWYRSSRPELQAVVDIAAAVMTVLVVRKALHRYYYFKLAVAEKKGRTSFLGQVATEKGIVYRVEIEGKIYELTTSGKASSSSVTYEEEMAMPGSEYFPCKNKSIGAVMVQNQNKDLKIFCVFWRLEDYLVTARHCANTLNQTTSDVYLCTNKETKHKNFEINTKKTYKVSEDFFDPIHNLIGGLHLDAYARELSETEWKQIGLAKAVVKLPSLYEQQVHTVGYTSNGLLVSASGRTNKGSGLELITHNASTQKGFSGSPVFCGTSAIALHVANDGTNNVAIRVECILYNIQMTSEQEAKRGKKFTYADAAYRDEFRQHKWRGGIMNAQRYGRSDTFAIELKNGECTYGWTMNQMAEAFGIYDSLEKNLDYIEDMIFDGQRSYGRNVRFEDECDAEVLQPWTVETGGKVIHGPRAPTKQPEIVKAFEAAKDVAIECGYEAGKYDYPDMSAETEEKSLVKHLEIASRGVQEMKRVPDAAARERVALLVAERCRAATFSPDADYNQISGIMRIINSSIINPKKASGFPFVADGMPTNAQVLKQYGEKGFAQLVLNEWDSELVLRWFLKGEPNKPDKLAQGRPRGLAGMPVHKLVKHASLFSNMARAFVENWRDFSVKYGYSPGNPGDIANLKKALPGKVWASDKQTWDFNAKEWHFQVYIRVIQLLAIKPDGMTDAAFKHYLEVDVPNAVKEIYVKSVYRCSNGSTYRMNFNGVMKSGWYLTINGNSVMQLIHNDMVLVMLEKTNDYILSKRIIAGGDDVLQEPACDDVEAYKAMSAELGVVMEIEEHEGLEHAEFFSADLRLDEMNRWQFFPQRFTKHVEHLLTIKKPNLASALSNYMGDHRHDEAKYNFFLKLFHLLRKDDPGHFPSCFLKGRHALLAAQYGYEE